MNILSTGMGWIDHTPGGLNRYFADYLAAMNNEGHSITGLMTAYGMETSAPDYIHDVLSKPARLNTFARANAFREQVKRGIELRKPDVFNPHFALYASLVTKKLIPKNVPVITHFHGPWAQESLVEDRGQELGQTIRYRIKKQVELLAYRRSDHFIVLSSYFRDILSNEYQVAKERIHIIPGGVDHQRFRPAENRGETRRSLQLKEHQQVLFCTRRLVNRMGLDRLIQAMVKIKQQAEHAVLYIAGDGPLRHHLERMVEELQLSSSVFLLGRVSNEELVSWYQAADMSIVPTVTLEGFGLVTVEALACGTPVLGTPYGGTKEILSQLSGRLLFAESSPDALAAKIISVLTGECILPSRQECRRHAVKHYNWGKVARSVTGVFEQAVEDRQRYVNHYY